VNLNAKGLGVVCLVLALSFLVVAVEAAPSLSLSFYKNNGYGMGNDINGQWTVNTAVSQDVVYVEFYLDEQLQKNATAAPFNWSFDTVNYTEGDHTIRVVAYNSLGEKSIADSQRNFVGFPVNFVVEIIVLVVVVMVLSLVFLLYRVRKQDAKKNQS
jgi:hypothetical protein